MTNPDREELVKLLVWGKSRITGEVGVMAQDAYTSIGHYIASDSGWFLQGQSGWNASASMDAAKAAAQADYKARIRSALVEVPPSDPSSTRSDRWVCAARQRSITLDPQDCDWPGCGCDPLANKVLDTIAESGFVIVPKDPSSTRSEVTALASLQGEDAVERVKALARRFWSIHPSTIAAMNLTREEFYAREMMALLATGIVPDEAAVRADNTANLISIIADIREKTGLGGKPMLNELADAIKDRISDLERQLAAETERCARICDQIRNNAERRAADHKNDEARNSALDKMVGAIECAAAIRGGAK